MVSGQAKQIDGQRLFDEYCATCHEPEGKVRQEWRSSFRKLPPNLAVNSMADMHGSEGFDRRRDLISKIVKFGIPGTDMAGHEYLPDLQIEAIAGLVAKMDNRGGNGISQNR